MNCLELPFPPLPQFLTVGHSFWAAGQQHFARSFQVYDVLIVNQGTLYQTEDGVPYTVAEGEMLVLEPNKPHWGHLPCEEETEIYWFHFFHAPPTRTLLSEQIPWTNVLNKGTDFDIKPSEHSMYLPKFGKIDLLPIKPILDKMVLIHNQFSMHNALHLHTLLVQLLHQLQLAVHDQQTNRSLEICQMVIEFFHTHFAQPIHAGFMQKKLHFHIDYMSRCLKRHTGMSMLQYLNYVRIEEAKKLLLDSNLSLQQIAGKVGIPQYNYFIRLFRKSCGVTPGVYRQIKQGYI